MFDNKSPDHFNFIKLEIIQIKRLQYLEFHSENKAYLMI